MQEDKILQLTPWFHKENRDFPFEWRPPYFPEDLFFSQIKKIKNFHIQAPNKAPSSAEPRVFSFYFPQYI